MDAGDKRYFCADVSCDVVINATKGGKQMAKPLLLYITTLITNGTIVLI